MIAIAAAAEVDALLILEQKWTGKSKCFPLNFNISVMLWKVLPTMGRGFLARLILTGSSATVLNKINNVYFVDFRSNELTYMIYHHRPQLRIYAFLTIRHQYSFICPDFCLPISKLSTLEME